MRVSSKIIASYLTIFEGIPAISWLKFVSQVIKLERVASANLEDSGLTLNLGEV